MSDPLSATPVQSDATAPRRKGLPRSVDPAKAKAATPVIFRRWRDPDGGIIALLPTIPCSYERDDLCTSYEHVGQHGAALYTAVIASTFSAKPEEYADLLVELAKIGYSDLRAYRREQPWMRRAKAKTVEGWREADRRQAATTERLGLEARS
jgi:hypothetical protein